MAGAELTNPCALQSGGDLITSLPTELIIKILGIVGTYDWHGLKSPLADCALVSHTWNTLCRPHMFHTVTLSSNTVLRRLSFLHFQAPHLCHYIRAVYFEAAAAERIVAKAKWFPECLARLTNLHKLRFFHCVDDLLPAASLAAFAAPQVRRLFIEGWKFASVYDLLSMFPPSLEELQLESLRLDYSPNNVASRALESKAPRIPGVRLGALRNLEIMGGDKSIFATPHLIECPNLARLSVFCWLSGATHMPPWLPANLPELVLYGWPDIPIPHFGALRPALVTLSISSDTSTPYLNFFTWVRDCINRLPDPRAIRALTIDITGYKCIAPPALSDYEMFSQFLCRLRESEWGGRSCLQSITLRINLPARTLNASDTPDGVAARELAKLEKGFAPLVEDNVLDADLITLSRNGEPEDSAPLCSIRRRV